MSFEEEIILKMGENREGVLDVETRGRFGNAGSHQNSFGRVNGNTKARARTRQMWY